MSFFISPHAARRLEVEAAGVEAHPLADERDLRRVGIAPDELDQARGAGVGRGGADGVDQRQVVGQQARADDLGKHGAVAGGKVAGGLGKLGRAEVVGGGVDEIADEPNAVGDAADIGGVEVGSDHQAARLTLVGAVAGEAVGAERPGKGRQRRVVETAGQGIGAGRHGARQLAGEQAGALGRFAGAQPEEHAGDAAGAVGNQRHIARPRRRSPIASTHCFASPSSAARRSGVSASIGTAAASPAVVYQTIGHVQISVFHWLSARRGRRR